MELSATYAAAIEERLARVVPGDEARPVMPRRRKRQRT
jgi:hypothetical protein